MKKIVQVNSSSSLGGGPQVMWDVVKGIKEDFEFEVMAPQGVFLEKYKELGIETTSLETTFLGKIAKIRSKLKENPDIIHAHGTRTAIWVRLASIGINNKTKLVYTLHGFHLIRKPPFLKWPLLLLESFLNKWTDVLVCVGKEDKKLVLDYGTIQPDKIRVIYPGVDPERFKIKQDRVEQAEEKLNLSNKFIMLSVGRLHPQKDFSTIIKAVGKITSTIKNIKLLIVGDGPLRKELEQQTSKLGVERYVDFLGFREDVPLLIQLSDVVILSTNWEGLSRIPLEAGISKKPIIASNVGGAKEPIQEGETGLLFKKNDPDELKDKILKLYQSPQLRKQMGQKGYQCVLEKFTKSEMVKQYKKLFQSLQ